MSETRWQTCKSAGIACAACGKVGSCTVSPDRLAFKCWRDGGKVHQTGNGEADDNGTGYVGKAHRKPKGAAGGGRAHLTAEAAIAAIGRTINGANLAGVWTYHARGGAELMKVARFDQPDGDKQFRPVHLTKDGWRVGDPSGPLPLYGLTDLPDTGTLYLCEGEKATEAARMIGLAATTSAHGAGSAEKTDWTPLAGRDVVILPDADAPGAKYARAVATIGARLTPPARVKIVELAGLPDGGDVVEFLAAGGTRESIEALADIVPFIGPVELLGGAVMRCLADVETESIAWLWEGRFALGKLSLIGGVPGVGKSWLSLYIAAAISRGLAWPDGRGSAPLGSVIIANAEDGAADTIKPRLLAMAADCRRIHILDCIKRPAGDGKMIEMGFTLERADDLDQAIRRTPDCKAIIIDPVSAHLAGTDEHKNGEVRALLKPLAKLAERHGVAILCVTHLNKGGGTNSVHRMIGSIAFAGAARSVWMVAKDQENPIRRLMLLAKCNIAADGGGLAYAIVDGALAWERDPVQMSADDALAVENGIGDEKPGPDPVKQNAAKDWLRERLAAGPVYVGDVKNPAPGTIRADVKDAGLSWSTVRRAAEDLEVKSEQCPHTKKYQWRLLKLVAQDVSSTKNMSNLSNQQISDGIEPILTPDPVACSGSNHLSNHDTGDAALDDYDQREREALQQEGM